MFQNSTKKIEPRKTPMIDMTSTFPYFLVRNSGEKEEVPSIIVPSADGSYYKVVDGNQFTTRVLLMKHSLESNPSIYS